MNVDKLLKLSEPQFLHLQKKTNMSIGFHRNERLSRGLAELLYVNIVKEYKKEGISLVLCLFLSEARISSWLTRKGPVLSPGTSLRPLREVPCVGMDQR